MQTLLQDLRFGLRMLVKNPGFTAVAVLTLALGVGGTTAIFSVLYGVVLDPFPYPDSHRMAVLVAHDPAQGGEADWTGVSTPEFLDYQEQNRVFDEVIGAAEEAVTLTGREVPERLTAVHVTCNTFQVLGLPPLVGRPLTAEDCKPDAPPVAVLGHKAWREKFGSDPGIVGQTLVLNHRPATVVGIMPARFSWRSGEIWLPAILSRGEDADQSLRFSLIGRLKPGVSEGQASADIGVVAKRLAAVYPKEHPKEVTFGVESLCRMSVGRTGIAKTLYILLGAVGLLLLIACANVANLLLARATEREREFAVRAALGASRSRLVRQVMIESLLLALFGGALGCLLTWNGMGALLAIMPKPWHGRELLISVNGPVLMFALAIALLSTLLFGLVPALWAAGRDMQEPLKTCGSGCGETSRRHRLRNLLVVSEVALSLVLLSGAGLLMRKFLALVDVRLGYNLDRTLSVLVGLPENQYNSPERRTQFQLDFLRAMRSTPGVAAATLNSPPVPWEGVETTLQIAGKPAGESQRARLSRVGDQFFDFANVPLLQGRDVSERDLVQRNRVAVVNSAFARRYFAGENPLGRQVKIDALETKGAETSYSVQQPWFEVIGVSEDMLATGNINGPVTVAEPTLYIPWTADDQPSAQVVLRTVGKPAGIENSLRRASAALDKELPLIIWSLEEQRQWLWYSFPRFVTTLLVSFASVGLLLVCMGVYSVLSYAVSRRTQEIGVRMALGAQAMDVRRMVMMAGLRWLAVGIAIGIPASVALAKILQNRIWGIKSADPLTLVAVSLLLTLVGLAACYMPARRATKVDPMVALRYE